MAETAIRRALDDVLPAGTLAAFDDDGERLEVRLALEAIRWNLQGRREDAGFLAAATALLGFEPPGRPGGVLEGHGRQLLTLAPGSWWIVAPVAAALPDWSTAAPPIFAAGGALFDLGSARVSLDIGGPAASRALARGTSIDLDPAAFPVGECRSTSMARMQSVIVRRENSLFRVHVNRSYANSFWEWLVHNTAGPIR